MHGNQLAQAVLYQLSQLHSHGSSMCQMLNLFLPSEVPCETDQLRGFGFSSGGELQKDFVARFHHEQGTFLVGFNGYCLCGFNDWEAMYKVARTAMLTHDVKWAAVVHFWSGDRYELVEREVDPDDTAACTPVEEGEVVVLRHQPPARRQHRQVLTTLERSVGQRVSLKLKNGRAIHGVLTAFDANTEVGQVEGQVIVAGQVFTVHETG